MISILLVALGYTAHGITNTIWKNPQEKIGTLPLILFRSFCCFIIFSTLHLTVTKNGILPTKTFTNIDLLKTIGICCVNYFGLFFFLKSLKETQVSNSIGFSKIGLFFGVIVGFFYYKETLSLEKILACVVLLLAVSIIEKSVTKTREKISKGLVYTTLSRLFWSTYFFFPIVIGKMGVLLFCTILEACVFSMSLLLYIFEKNKQKINFKNIDSHTKIELIILVVLGTIGTLCSNFAVAKVGIVTIAFIGLLEPVVGLILSVFYHKEKINKLQFIGLSLGLVTFVVLSVL